MPYAVPGLSDVEPVLRRLTGRTVVSADPVTEGGYSPTARWLVRWDDGGTAFVKAEMPFSEHYGAQVEHLVYSSVDASCLPRLDAYDDGPPRVLVIEDLSTARWGTPLTADDCALLVSALDSLAEVRAPDGLRAVSHPHRWAGLAADSAALVATGLVSAGWVSRCASVLAGAEASADPSGDRLVHCDLWLQNWCRTSRGAVLIDWAGAAHGNPLVMRAWGEAGVRAAGGPPGVVLSGHPEWAAWMAGQTSYFLTDAGYERTAGREETERREGLAVLRWACDELGLPHPDADERFTSLGPWRP